MTENLAIAVDLGATNLRAAIVNKKGKVLKRAKTKTPAKGKILVIKSIIVLINVLLEDYKKQNIKGIGVSAASPINEQGLIKPPNLPFKKLVIKKPLKNYFKLPVILANDCQAAVYGEKIFGAGKNYKNLVYVTISTGIGAGAIVDNHLLSGQTGNAAEVGHFIIDTKYNILCSCKKGRGHWEAICSGKNLPRFFKIWLKHHNLNLKPKYKIKTAKQIFNLADKKDKIVLNFLKEVGQFNGHGMSNVIVAYNPELITLGGAVVLNNKKYILPELKNNIDKFLKTPKIIVTPLKEDITLLGAAALVLYPAPKRCGVYPV